MYGGSGRSIIDLTPSAERVLEDPDDQYLSSYIYPYDTYVPYILRIYYILYTRPATLRVYALWYFIYKVT